MLKGLNTSIKYIVTTIAVLGLIFVVFPTSSNAQTVADPFAGTNGDMGGILCNVLNQIGLTCIGSSNKNNVDKDIVTNPNNSTTGNTNSNSSIFSKLGFLNITGAIFKGSVKSAAGGEISLVQVPGRPELYQIINGRKHLIPNLEIFYNYGYKPEMVQPISEYELSRYIRASLIKTGSSKNVYYLTETGMVRLIPDPKIYSSYGATADDIITVSSKEFNFYPVNKFIYQEYPLNRDVFEIVGTNKVYLTPMAIYRMNITDNMVAPVNQYEFNYYKIGAPVIY